MNHDLPSSRNYCLWLGAVLERLRRGEPPIPPDPAADPQGTESWFRRDQARFGYTDQARAEESERRHEQQGPWEHVAPPEELAECYQELLTRVRGQAWERAFWRHALTHAPWPPPDSVLNDLLARDIETTLIGHLPLCDQMLWKLADQVPEALLTLAKRRYASADVDEHRFEEVLNAYPRHRWMLQSLAWLTPSSRAKAVVLAKHIREIPDRDDLLKNQSRLFAEAWGTL